MTSNTVTGDSSFDPMKSKYDAVILGAGHNGLAAASYLGRAGLSVLLLEKNDYIGGATTSQKIFHDYDAQLESDAYDSQRAVIPPPVEG